MKKQWLHSLFNMGKTHGSINLAGKVKKSTIIVEKKPKKTINNVRVAKRKHFNKTFLAQSQTNKSVLHPNTNFSSKLIK